MFLGSIRLRKDFLIVFEDLLQEVVLYVFAPKRDAILLLEMADLVARVYRGDASVCIAADRSRVRGVVGFVGFGCLFRIALHGFCVVGARSIGLRVGGSFRVFHSGRFGGEDVS